MKQYFIRLMNYDRFANELILNSILSSGATGKPVELMAHMLAAQQIWLKRCKREPAPGGALWPDWFAKDQQKISDDNHAAWIAFLEGLQDADFQQIINYQNSRGDTFSNTLSDIIAHLINHGTHHRAQAGQHLKAAGVELPATDYIFYLRQL